MRNIFLVHDGGAVANPPVQSETLTVRPTERNSEIEVTDGPKLAASRADRQGDGVDARRARLAMGIHFLHGLAGRLSDSLKRAMRSDAERYLAGSTDLADLERRLEAITRGEHRSFD